jgi:exo-beta-1,3-glucanase (GH17 family)
MLSAVPNLGAAVDAFAVHPYAANTSVDTWTGSNWQTAKLDRKIRPDLISHGLGDKPIWVTEIGWPTCGSACRGFTELEQAANVARFDRLVRTEWTYVKAVFYYALNDQDGGSGDLTDREQWFGTIRRDGSFKPAYDALRAAFTA